MSRDAVATIDLSALRHNFLRVREVAPGCNILAMIKSDAYGHGAVRVAQALSEAEGFGVATLHEAITLREAGIAQPIVVLSRFDFEVSLPLFSRYGLSAAVQSVEQVEILDQASLPEPIGVWLKIDTGMHRLGVSPDLARGLYERLQQCASVKKPIHLMTHLADADSLDSTFTEQQLACFDAITDGIVAPKSSANSAALLRYPKALGDWVRPGIMLYGVSPFSGRTACDEGLKPVMTLSAELVSLKVLKKGDRVGYNGTWVAPEAMVLGIVGIGYGDGYPRHVPSGTPTLLHNTICPLVGRVSMDLLAIDCRQVANPKLGDTVTLWGEGLPIEKIAESAGTIAYELLCHVAERVRFIEKSSVEG